MPAPLDPRALAEHADFVRRLAWHLVRDDADADDVAQEALARAIARPPADGERPRPWLVGVLRNVVRHLRRDRARRDRRERAAARPECVAGPEVLAARAEAVRDMAAAVAALDEPYRTVVLLRYYDALPPREIAARLAIPVETVHGRLKRARERLRARLEEVDRGRENAWRRVLAGLFGPGDRLSTGAGSESLRVRGGGTAVASRVKAAAVVATILILAGGAHVALRPFADRPRPPESDGTSSGPVGRADSPRSEAAHLAPIPPRVPNPGRPGATPATDPATRIHGLVVDVTGGPIVGCLIGVFGMVESLSATGEEPAQVEARTDDQGEFEVSAAPGRSYRVRASAPGFTTEVVWIGSPPRDLRLTLCRAAGIEGRVLDADDGTPLAGARVTATSPPDFDFTAPRWAGTAHTGPDGAYAFRDAPPGRFRLETWPASHAPSSAEVTTTLGHTTTRDLAVARGCRLVGVVLDHAGAPVAGAEVRADGRLDGSIGTGVHADAEGRFTIDGLLPGTWSLSAMGSGTGWARATVDVPTGMRTVSCELRTSPTTTIEGRVLVRGAPAPGALVEHGPYWDHPATAVADAAGRFVLVVPDWGGQASVRATVDGVGSAEVKADQAPGKRRPVDIGVSPWGTVRGRILPTDAGLEREVRLVLGELPPEDYTSSVAADGSFVLRVREGHWRVQALAPGWPLSPETYVDVEAARTTAGVEVAFRSGASIRGRVVDDRGEPVPRVHVTLDTRDGQPYPFEVTTDEAGRFEAHGIHVADVIVTVCGWGYEGTGTKHVHVGPEEVVLTAPRLRDVLRGRVVGADGSPCTSFTLLAWTLPADAGTPDAKARLAPPRRFVDRQGRFDYPIEVPAPGRANRYALQASTEDGVSQRESDVVASESADAEVRLRVVAGGFIRGRVADLAGAPIDRAVVTAYAPEGRSLRVLSDRSGSYRVGPLAPGSVEMTVSGTVGTTWLGTRRLHPTVEVGNEAVADVTLSFGGDVQLWVTDGKGRAVVGARAQFLDAKGEVIPVDAERTSVNGPRPFVPKEAQETSDLAGRIRRRFLPPETRRVRVTGDGYETAETPVSVTEGGSLDLRVVLTAAPTGTAGR